MQMGFSKLDNPRHEGATNTWLTPLPLVNALGKFDLDPCAFANHPTADKLITLPTDGLAESWKGRVWLNPPYGKSTARWIKKLRDHGNGIALVFSRTDTSWFHSAKPYAIFFLQGRISFLDENFRADTNAGHGSMLLAYGHNNVLALSASGLKGTLAQVLE